MRPAAILAIAMLAAPVGAQPLDPGDCLEAPYSASDTPARAALSALVTDLRVAVDPFPSLSEALATGGARFCLTGQDSGASGWFAPGEATIVLHESLSPAMRRVVLLHELRHLDQNTHGACPGPSLARESYAEAVMAMEADASAIAALVAFAWAKAGTREPWAALADWPTQADIAMRLEDETAAGSTTAEAVAAAFRQWYAHDARRESYWRAACTAYLDREDETHALRRYGALDRTFWTDLCVLPDGQNYACGPSR